MTLSELYLEIWKERTHKCTGCGKFLGYEPLTYFFSHTIKKSSRPDLKLDKDNIELECINCHQHWESRIPHKIVKLLNFNKKMLYIKEKDINLYDKLNKK